MAFLGGLDPHEELVGRCFAGLQCCSVALPQGEAAVAGDCDQAPASSCPKMLILDSGSSTWEGTDP